MLEPYARLKTDLPVVDNPAVKPIAELELKDLHEFEDWVDKNGLFDADVLYRAKPTAAGHLRAPSTVTSAHDTARAARRAPSASSPTREPPKS